MRERITTSLFNIQASRRHSARKSFTVTSSRVAADVEALPDAEELPGDDVAVRLVVPLGIAPPVVGPADPGHAARRPPLVRRSGRLYDVAGGENGAGDVVTIGLGGVFGFCADLVDAGSSAGCRVVAPVPVNKING